ncbi:hypothetical protein ACMDCR_10205 [Labrys okinawensis]|uniref:hypothetical protein n=1 Tax=Labrys okinawensis TaxID=346911 RepID=UPI0039BD49AF
MLLLLSAERHSNILSACSQRRRPMPRITSITADGTAYRRGIVLGLTMAEIMLLLVFCLLIALSAMFTREKQQNDSLAAQLAAARIQIDEERAKEKTLTAKADDLKSQIKRLSDLLNAMQVAGPKSDNDWMKLVDASKIVDAIRASGVDPQQVVKYANQLNDLVDVLSSNAKGTEVAEAWRKLQTAKGQLQTRGLQDVAIQDLDKVIVEGVQAERDKKQGLGEHDWPPIINLSEASGYSFAVGKADLTPSFQSKLKTSVIDQVADIVSRYNVDIVEVIGHTDEQTVNNRISNLDGKLISASDGSFPIDGLTPADNAGLGMARAVSVASILRSDPKLKGVTVLPLSAAQMIMPGDKSADGTAKGNVKERRRIEIRVRRSVSKLADAPLPQSSSQ